MPDEDFRPLSLGEVLDRSFSLYRSHFLLFAGISAAPHLFTLVCRIVEIGVFSIPFENARRTMQAPPTSTSHALAYELAFFVVELFVVYLFIQAATTDAVSGLYLGRATTAGAALRRVWARIGPLFGCELLTGLALMVTSLVLFVPGIYLACRLIVALPAATIEKIGPAPAFERSMVLTLGNAGRAFMIYALYLLLRLMVAAATFYPDRLLFLLAFSEPRYAWVCHITVQLMDVVTATLLAPILAIAASVFYFDLRVKKEALDLAVMMNPQGWD